VPNGSGGHVKPCVSGAADVRLARLAASGNGAELMSNKDLASCMPHWPLHSTTFMTLHRVR